jgi:hypothetical protein
MVLKRPGRHRSEGIREALEIGNGAGTQGSYSPRSPERSTPSDSLTCWGLLTVQALPAIGGMGGGDSGSELHAPFFSSACHLDLDARFGIQDFTLQGEPPVKSPAKAPPAAGFR